MAQSIKPPYSAFIDKDGTLLQGGFIYIGVANANPETNPAKIYWDSALTIQASQPLKTLNGAIVRSGTPANCYILSDFSMTVKNKHQEIISAILSFATSGVIQAYAAAGANSDITSLNALATPLSAAQGGTQQFWVGAVSGINTLVAATITPVTGFALTAGVRVSAIIAAINTGATTLNVNSSGDVGIVINGDAGLAALIGNELQINSVADFEYNGTVWVLTNPFLPDINIAFKGNNTHAGTETFNNKIIVSGGAINTPGGRLTITTGVPVLTTDTIGQTTVYYTSYAHNMIMLYNGTSWETRFFTELSQALSDTTKSPAASVASTAYDYFVWDDAGTLRHTRGPAWAVSAGVSASRGTGVGTTELIRQNGTWVNARAITNGPAIGKGVYTGSIITNAANQVDWVANPAAAVGGGNARLGLWNMYNRVDVGSTSKESANTWASNTAAWQAQNGSNSNRITIFAGMPEDAANVKVTGIGTNGVTAGSIIGAGVGVGSVTVASGTIGTMGSPGGATLAALFGEYVGVPSLGSQFFQQLEYGTANNTYSGNNGNAAIYQAGISLKWRG